MFVDVQNLFSSQLGQLELTLKLELASMPDKNTKDEAESSFREQKLSRFDRKNSPMGKLK